MISHMSLTPKPFPAAFGLSLMATTALAILSVLLGRSVMLTLAPAMELRSAFAVLMTL